MAKTYFSNKTRAQHTYTFFKDRRDDPEWHDEFVRIRIIRRREKLVQTIFGLIIVLVFFVAWHGYKAATSKNNLIPASSKLSSSSSSISNSDDSSEEKSSTESNTDTTDESSSESSSSKVSSSSSDNGVSKVARQLVGKSFTIVPIKYDGVDIDKAMDDNKAPQNTVHDSHIDGTFLSSSEMRYRIGIDPSKYFKGKVSVLENSIQLDTVNKNFDVSYVMENNQVVPSTWNETVDGHTVTMQMQIN